MVEVKGWWRQWLVRSRGGGSQRVVRVKECGWWGSRGGVMGGGMVKGVGWWA